jgi:hypothetical protein
MKDYDYQMAKRIQETMHEIIAEREVLKLVKERLKKYKKKDDAKKLARMFLELQKITNGPETVDRIIWDQEMRITEYLRDLEKEFAEL